MWKAISVAAVLGISFAPAALADTEDGVHRHRLPAERLGALDRRLDRAEFNGRIEQGSRADLAENRFDRFEDRVDRRESIRDEAIDYGRLDVIEDRFDRAESVLDRRENVVDRRRRG